MPSLVSRDADDSKKTYLNEILSFGLGDKWLELRCGESIHKTCLGNYE